MNLASLKEIRPILEKNGFNFSKGLGQNFLINESIPKKIAQLCPSSKSSLAIEIGDRGRLFDKGTRVSE